MSKNELILMLEQTEKIDKSLFESEGKEMGFNEPFAGPDTHP